MTRAETKDACMANPRQGHTASELRPPSKSGFSLVIERGQSRHPERPIQTDRFLIGAGSNCHLQLGGNIPMLHSIIVPAEGSLWIDAVVAEPALIVNGTVIRDGELHPEDVLEIGEFVFRVHSTPMTSDAEPAPVETPASERTAAELLQVISDELKSLNQFENSRRHAANALMDAARRESEIKVAVHQPDQRAAVLDLLSQLHERSQLLDKREATLNDHARKLAASYQELQETLQSLNYQPQRVSTLGGDEELQRSA